jgi:hypothetical protein
MLGYSLLIKYYLTQNLEKEYRIQNTEFSNLEATLGNFQYGSVKGERGKVSNTSFTPYPLTFSQTTRELHTAYPNRIEWRVGGKNIFILGDVQSSSGLPCFLKKVKSRINLKIFRFEKLICNLLFITVLLIISAFRCNFRLHPKIHVLVSQ